MADGVGNLRRAAMVEQMSSESAKAIVEAVDAALRPHGFRRRGKTWTVDAIDTVLVINLDRGYSGLLLTLGIVIKAVAHEPKPVHAINYYDAHIILSAAACVPEWRRMSYKDTPLYRLFDPDAPMDQEHRAYQITQLVADRLLPFFRRCCTIDDLSAMYHAGDLTNAGVRRDAQVVLEGKQG